MQLIRCSREKGDSATPKRKRIDNSELERQTKHQKGNSALEIIPTDVWFNILSRVASYSISDLYQVRQSCKEFKALVGDDRVLRHANLEGVALYLDLVDPPKLESFLLRCERSGNPQALYRHGLIECFRSGRPEVASELWKKATKGGHVGAEYLLGVILLSSMDDESNKQGMTLLKGLEARLGNVKLAEIRRNCVKVLESFDPPIFVQREKDFCPDPKCRDSVVSLQGWDGGVSFWKNAYNKKCKLCNWDYELRRFRIMQCPPTFAHI